MMRAMLKKGGFTLVEILLATTILAIMTGMVLTMTTQVIQVWENASGKLSAGNEAQLALELMSQDLEAAIFQNDGREWLHLAAEPGVGEGSWIAPAAVHLMFYATARDSLSRGGGVVPDAMPGGLSAVSYRLGFRDPFENAASGPHRRFGLYRAAIPPEITFEEAMTAERQRDIRTFVWQSAQAGDWGDLAGNGGSISPRDWSYDVSNLLANHVVRFEVRLEYLDTFGNLQGVRIGGGGASRVSLRGDVLLVDGDSRRISRLIAGEISLTVLTEKGASVIRRETDSISDNDLGGDLETVIAQEGEVFSRKVRFVDF